MYFISNPFKHFPSSPCMLLTLYDKLVLLPEHSQITSLSKIVLSVAILDAEYLLCHNTFPQCIPQAVTSPNQPQQNQFGGLITGSTQRSYHNTTCCRMWAQWACLFTPCVILIQWVYSVSVTSLLLDTQMPQCSICMCIYDTFPYMHSWNSVEVWKSAWISKIFCCILGFHILQHGCNLS